jgi:hypothetical protein
MRQRQQFLYCERITLMGVSLKLSGVGEMALSSWESVGEITGKGNKIICNAYTTRKETNDLAVAASKGRLHECVITHRNDKTVSYRILLKQALITSFNPKEGNGVEQERQITAIDFTCIDVVKEYPKGPKGQQWSMVSRAFGDLAQRLK